MFLILGSLCLLWWKAVHLRDPYAAGSTILCRLGLIPVTILNTIVMNALRRRPETIWLKAFIKKGLPDAIISVVGIIPFGFGIDFSTCGDSLCRMLPPMIFVPQFRQTSTDSKLLPYYKYHSTTKIAQWDQYQHIWQHVLMNEYIYRLL